MQGGGGIRISADQHYEGVRCNVTGVTQAITFEASDRSRSIPLTLSHFPASELSLAPIREIACYKLCLFKR